MEYLYFIDLQTKINSFLIEFFWVIKVIFTFIKTENSMEKTAQIQIKIIKPYLPSNTQNTILSTKKLLLELGCKVLSHIVEGNNVNN